MTSATSAALILSIALIAWAALMRAVAGTWLQPSAFFALWWCVAGVLPLIFTPQEPVGPNAIAWLLAASVAVGGGALAGNRGLRTHRLRSLAVPTNSEVKVFGAASLLSLALGIGSNIAFLTGLGIPVTDVLQLDRLVIVANQLYFLRYADNPAPPPPLSQALLPFVFLAPAAGGILFVLRREIRWKAVALLAFLPAVAVTVLQTTKAAVLFAFTLWFSGYFATRLRLGKLAVFTMGHFGVAAVLTLIVTPFFFAVALARLASTDVALAGDVMKKFLTYAFAHMTVFSQWLGEYMSQPVEPTLGTVTFAGPLELFGYQERIPGLFATVVQLLTGDTSNIYTAFRPLIQDFTIPGALAVLALLGFMGGIGFRLVAAGQWSGMPLLVAAYATIFWSPITWFWIYNSLTATFLAIFTMVWFVRFWRGRAQPALLQENRWRRS